MKLNTNIGITFLKRNSKKFCTSEKLTPAMAQYKSIKEKYKDYLLLFQVGDFFEMYGQDAEIGSKILVIIFYLFS